MTKKDLITGLIIGVLIGILSLFVLKNVEVVFEESLVLFNFPQCCLLLIIFPLLIAIGLSIADLISRKIKVIWQVAKYIVVGGLDTFIYLGILNLLIWISNIGTSTGFLYGLFTFFSFSLVTFNSYFWNKFWTFEKGREFEKKEFSKFYFLRGIGTLINLGVVLILVNTIRTPFHIQEILWIAVIAPFIGILIAFIWNFLSYRAFVFKK